MRCGSICAKLKAIQLASDREYALSSMSYDANHESLEVRHEAALFSKTQLLQPVMPSVSGVSSLK